MKTESRKLNLSRETVMPLQNDELELVNGGTLSIVVQSAVRSSQACIRAVSASVASVASAVSRYFQSRGNPQAPQQ